MDRADMQKLVEEIVSLYLQSSEEADREEYAASRMTDEKAEALELVLRGEGYELADDPDDIELLHVKQDAVIVASFDTGAWSWKEETQDAR